MKKGSIMDINRRINFKALFGLPISYYRHTGAIAKQTEHRIIVKEYIGKLNF